MSAFSWPDARSLRSRPRSSKPRSREGQRLGRASASAHRPLTEQLAAAAAGRTTGHQPLRVCLPDDLRTGPLCRSGTMLATKLIIARRGDILLLPGPTPLGHVLAPQKSPWLGQHPVYSSRMCRFHATKGGAVIEGLSFRDGKQVDLSCLIKIAALCFSPGDLDGKSALPGRLAAGLATMQILVAERVRDGESAVVAYVQYHAVGDGLEYYVEGVAVHPDVRGANLARDLLVELRQRLHRRHRANPALVMTVSPRNIPMIRSVLAAGFFGSDFVSGYFGPKEDRIYFRSPLSPYTQLGESLLLPVDAYGETSARVANGYVIAAFEKLPQGAAYCLRKCVHDDPAPLSANETAASLTVASALLAAFAFLFGLSITTAIVPNDIRLFLGFGLLSSTFAMLVYGKSSGELSRIRRGVFNAQMQAGNLLCEFGGHYPLILLTPVVISRVTQSIGLSVVLCIGSVEFLVSMPRHGGPWGTFCCSRG